MTLSAATVSRSNRCAVARAWTAHRWRTPFLGFRCASSLLVPFLHLVLMGVSPSSSLSLPFPQSSLLVVIVHVVFFIAILQHARYFHD